MMPQDFGAAWEKTKHVAPDLQLLGHSNQYMSGNGKLWQALPGRAWGDPGWTPVSKIFQYTCQCSGMQMDKIAIRDADEWRTWRGGAGGAAQGTVCHFLRGSGCIASQDPKFLQQAIGILANTFNHVGLETNTKKTQAMLCRPRKICIICTF